MSEEQKTLTEKTFSFDSEELKEEVKNEFLINGTPLFKFEDKKGYSVKVLNDLEIVQRDTKFGIKYYIPIEINKEVFYWQASAKTLREILNGLETTVNFNVMLNSAEKTYNIIPVTDVK